MTVFISWDIGQYVNCNQAYFSYILHKVATRNALFETQLVLFYVKTFKTTCRLGGGGGGGGAAFKCPKFEKW